MNDFTRGSWYDRITRYLQESGIYEAATRARIKEERISKFIHQPMDDWEYEFIEKQLRSLEPFATEVKRLLTFHTPEAWEILFMDNHPVAEVTKLRNALRAFQIKFKGLADLKSERLVVEEKKKVKNFYGDDLPDRKE